MRRKLTAPVLFLCFCTTLAIGRWGPGGSRNPKGPAKKQSPQNFLSEYAPHIDPSTLTSYLAIPSVMVNKIYIGRNIVYSGGHEDLIMVKVTPGRHLVTIVTHFKNYFSYVRIPDRKAMKVDADCDGFKLSSFSASELRENEKVTKCSMGKHNRLINQRVFADIRHNVSKGIFCGASNKYFNDIPSYHHPIPIPMPR
jgi:hypothetical protein